MIEEIHIKNVAIFDSQETQKLENLAKLNYLYGSNGTGKTTISCLLADERKDDYRDCLIKWERDRPLRTMVYNDDFIKQNFREDKEIKGIFTLGKVNVNSVDNIEKKKEQVQELEEEIKKHTQDLEGDDGKGGKKACLGKIKEDLKTECWKKLKEYKPTFKKAFVGHMGSMSDFMDRVVRESESNNALPLVDRSDLEEKARVLFVDQSRGYEESIPYIPHLDVKKLVEYESKAILQRRVIGRKDVDIAEMIERLDNSPWVSAGRKYYEKNEGDCPFCQQKTTKKFAQDLRGYFDDTYEANYREIEILIQNYKAEGDRLQQEISSMAEILPVLNFEEEKRLISEKGRLLDDKVNSNLQYLERKKEDPARIVQLESISSVADVINSLIDSVNYRIKKHKDMVENREKEEAELTNQVWSLFLKEREIESSLDHYKKVMGEISSLEEEIGRKNKDKREKEKEIDKLEEGKLSVQYTITEINRILSLSGFKGFSLVKGNNNDNSYKIVRADGSDVRETLSDGEKNLITFLYFYHLLQGGHSKMTVEDPRVVVFDDPVSSVDSETMFLIVQFIKDIFKENDHVKQVFVLTHNIYFHKELTYKQNSTKDETFWILRKTLNKPKFEYCRSNPISTLYELLWYDVRKAQNEIDEGNRCTYPTIQNTLRRILEYYFKSICGLGWNDIAKEFKEGGERIICRSLISWLHAGSHFRHDDIHVFPDDSSVEKYLEMFHKVFEKTGHVKHYEMMMKKT